MFNNYWSYNYVTYIKYTINCNYKSSRSVFGQRWILFKLHVLLLEQGTGLKTHCLKCFTHFAQGHTSGGKQRKDTVIAIQGSKTWKLSRMHAPRSRSVLCSRAKTSTYDRKPWCLRGVTVCKDLPLCWSKLNHSHANFTTTKMICGTPYFS